MPHWLAYVDLGRMASVVDHHRLGHLAVVVDRDPAVFDMAMAGIQLRVQVVEPRVLEFQHCLGSSILPWPLGYQVSPEKYLFLCKLYISSQNVLTSLVFRFGVDREELEPEREGGLS